MSRLKHCLWYTLKPLNRGHLSTTYNGQFHCPDYIKTIQNNLLWRTAPDTPRCHPHCIINNTCVLPAVYLLVNRAGVNCHSIDLANKFLELLDVCIWAVRFVLARYFPAVAWKYLASVLAIACWFCSSSTCCDLTGQMLQTPLVFSCDEWRSSWCKPLLFFSQSETRALSQSPPAAGSASSWYTSLFSLMRGWQDWRSSFESLLCIAAQTQLLPVLSYW